MNTEQTLEIESSKLEDTLLIGEQIGQNIKGGETIELIGDVGAGKTVLVRGIARGAQSVDAVSSPSFTISRVYKGKNVTLNHFDFYRLNDPGIIRNELDEEIHDQNTVQLIEWSDIVSDVLPPERIKVEIIPIDENSRMLKFSTSENLKYILKGIE